MRFLHMLFVLTFQSLPEGHAETKNNSDYSGQFTLPRILCSQGACCHYWCKNILQQCGDILGHFMCFF